MSEEDLILGDDGIHGESAYVFGPCEGHESHMLQAGNKADEEMAIRGVNPHDMEEKAAGTKAKGGESSK